MTAHILKPGEMATIRRVTPFGTVELVREPYSPQEEEVEVNIQVGNIPGVFDENSGTWAYIKQLLLDKINDARKQNDSIILGEKETWLLRGQIAAMKQLVDIPKTINGRNKRPQTHRPLEAGKEY